MRSVSKRSSSASVSRPCGAESLASSLVQTAGMRGSTTVRRSWAKRFAASAGMKKERVLQNRRENRCASRGMFIDFEPSGHTTFQKRQSICVPGTRPYARFSSFLNLFESVLDAMRSDHYLIGGRGSCSFASACGHALLVVLRVLGTLDVAFHESLRFAGISGADGAIDLAMDSGGVLEGSGKAYGFTPAIIESGSDRLHQGGQYRISRGRGDGAMKAHVVDKIL